MIERVGWNSISRVADQLQAARDQRGLRQGVMNEHRNITPQGVVDRIKSQPIAQRTNQPPPTHGLGGTATSNEASPLNQTSARTAFTPATQARSALREVSQGPNAGESVVNKAADAAQPGLPSAQVGSEAYIDALMGSVTAAQMIRRFAEISGIQLNR